MGTLGVGEIVGIIVILVLLFGAKKLPELGGSIGKSIKNFKRGIDEASTEDDDEAEDTVARSDTSATPDQS